MLETPVADPDTGSAGRKAGSPDAGNARNALVMAQAYVREQSGIYAGDGGYEIRVNSVHPTFIATDMVIGVARESGELQMQWKDEQGQTLSAQKTISVA